MAGQAAVKFSGSVMSGNREFKEFREFREIAPDCTATGHISALSRNFDRILHQSDSRVSVLSSLTLSAVISFILKLLILLKFPIVYHALPHAYGFAVIPSGMDIPGFAVTSLQVVYLTALLLLRAGLYTLFKKYPFLF